MRQMIPLFALAGAVGCASAAPTRQPPKPSKLTARSRPTRDIRDLLLRDWKPRSMLRTPVTVVRRPAFYAIDVHNHLGRAKDVAAIVRAMDAAGVKTVINLDGMWGDRLAKNVARFDRAYPGRFLTFALIDFRGIDDANWSARTAAQLEKDFQAGAKGLKFHKSLGLTIRYKNGKLMPVDDAKLDPIWRMCAKYKRPVMIHTADPAAFFTPLDRFNERWHELNAHPGWLFYGKRFPRRNTLLEQRNRVFAKHPDTTFIGAHLGNNPEDLKTVARWLERYPNFYVDIDARISELGRQPYAARRFLIKYQDRVLFGTDTFPRADIYGVYYRFLETRDEYWDVAAGHHRQGFWMVHSLGLPKEVLRKVYHLNAQKVLRLAPTKKDNPAMARLAKARVAVKANKLARAARLLAHARKLARGDWAATNAVVKLDATIKAYQGRYDQAIAALVARLAAAGKRRAHDWSEWGFHHTLALLRRAQGDLVSALLEVQQARAVGEQGDWSFPGRSRLMQIRLGDAWLRAHLLRLRAEQLHGSARTATLRYANDARAEYRRLAKQDGGHRDSIAVLDVIFAVHDGDKEAALAAARRVNYTRSKDVEDLYLTWVGFDYGGDAAAAAAVHARMKALGRVHAGVPVHLRWVDYDKAAKRGRRAHFTPRHPTARP